MRLILFSLFGFNVYSYGLMIGIGIITAVMILNSRARKRGYNENSIFNMIIITILSGILGGKLLFIITNLSDFINNPVSFITDFGYGFVIYGAILGGMLSIVLYSKLRKWDSLEIFDLVVPGLAIAQGFGRIGCLLAGCCYGAETAGALYVVFPENSLAVPHVHLHPTQIYSSIFDFALGIFLIIYSRKKRVCGKTFGLYLICYSIGRFFVEFLRDDVRGSVGMLSTSQFISIFILVLGIFIFNFNSIKKYLTNKTATN
ncbi:MAG: prolipoprotein diacylglyceryl transferase [Clostridium perfringens]|nr:prolipoprotein diacylglyceryl transferase [Clostridium perfringens]